MQRLQAEETALLVSIARLSKEKTALLSRARCADAAGAWGVGDGAVEAGGGCNDAGEALGGGRASGEKDECDSPEGFAEETEMRALLLAKRQRAAEMEREKDRLQARCRELQVGRRKGDCACAWLVAVVGGSEQYMTGVRAVHDGLLDHCVWKAQALEAKAYFACTPPL